MIIGTFNPARPVATQLHGPTLVNVKESRKAARKAANERLAARRKEIEDAEAAVELIDLNKLLNIVYPDWCIAANGCQAYQEAHAAAKQWMESANAAYYEYDSDTPGYYHDFIEARIRAHKAGKTKMVICDVS